MLLTSRELGPCTATPRWLLADSLGVRCPQCCMFAAVRTQTCAKMEGASRDAAAYCKWLRLTSCGLSETRRSLIFNFADLRLGIRLGSACLWFLCLKAQTRRSQRAEPSPFQPKAAGPLHLSSGLGGLF